MRGEYKYNGNPYTTVLCDSIIDVYTPSYQLAILGMQY